MKKILFALAALLFSQQVTLADVSISLTPSGGTPVTGSGNTTSTGATTIIAAPAATFRIYVLSIQCVNSGVTASTITLNDTASTVLMNPAGNGEQANFRTPLMVPTATALTFTPGSSSTTQFCSAQGFINH